MDPMGFDLEDEDVGRTPMAARFSMTAFINTAWLGHSLSRDHHFAWSDAWEVLVAREEWRQWATRHLHPTQPFLYLALRDDLDKRRLLKTRNGVSFHVPASEVYSASADDHLVSLYVDVIWTIYEKWSRVSGCPRPPAPPVVSHGKPCCTGG